MRNWMWIGLVALVVFAGFILYANSQQTVRPGGEGVGGGPGVLPEQKRFEVNLEPVNRDQINQSGKAVFTEMDGRVVVRLDVTKVEGINNQPAHVHMGSCPGVGEVVHPLNNVIDGRSATEINATIDQLKSAQSLMAINIHKSAEEVAVYTACGNLPR